MHYSFECLDNQIGIQIKIIFFSGMQLKDKNGYRFAAVTVF